MYTAEAADAVRLDGGEPRLLPFAAVPPFLRVLLVTDGTVTRSLEAYFGEAIEVQVLSHEEVTADRAHAAIHVVPGERIVSRKVILRGRDSGLAYGLAESAMAVARLPENLQRRLVAEPIGIGELIRASRLETYREILSIECMTAGAWARDLAVEETARIATRRYAIHFAARPMMEIREVFPEQPFRRR